MSTKPRVLIESPYGGGRPELVTYLERAIADSLFRGEAPFASHRLYPGILDDTVPEQRRRGIEAGFAWGEVAHFVAVYDDYGITAGMQEGLRRWSWRGIRVESRAIGQNGGGSA